MTHEEPPDIDRLLRDVFPRDTRAVSQVIRGALLSGVRQPPRWRLVVAGGIAVALLAVVLSVWPGGPEPVSPEVTLLSGSLTDDLLVLSLPDGSIAISDGSARENRPPDGYGVVLVEGALK